MSDINDTNDWFLIVRHSQIILWFQNEMRDAWMKMYTAATSTGSGVSVLQRVAAGRSRGDELSHPALVQSGLGAVGELTGAQQLCLPLCIRGPCWTCRQRNRAAGQHAFIWPNHSFQSVNWETRAIHSETGYPGVCLLCNQMLRHTLVISDLILMKLKRPFALWVLSECWACFGGVLYVSPLNL